MKVRSLQRVEHPTEGRRVRWIGFATVVAVVALLLTPILRSLRTADDVTHARPSDIESAGAQGSSADPTAAVTSLAQAVGALVQLEHARQRAQKATAPQLESEEVASLAWLDEPISDPPAASEFASPTACMASYLPEIELAEGALDFVCADVEFWSIEQRAYQRIVHREGEGARLWRKLGPFALAALATMRKGCCEQAEPLLAVVPGLWCGILRDVLRAFGPTATRTPFVDFDRTMTCLSQRGIRLPPHWGGGPRETGRQAFRRLTQVARQRGHSMGKAHPALDRQRD